MRVKYALIQLDSAVESALQAVSKVMAAVAAGVLGIMMLLTVADVTGRYFFNSPVNGSWELIGFLLVCAGTWGLAYCQVTKAHIQVTVLLDNFPSRLKAAITAITYLMGVIAFSLIFWRSVLLTVKYITERGHVSDTLEIPYYPFTVLMAAGVGMLVIVLLFDFLHSVGKVIRP